MLVGARNIRVIAPIFLTILVTSLACTGCNKSEPSEHRKTRLPIHCREMDANAKDALVKNIPLIGIGDQLSHVESVIGKPDFRQNLANKEGDKVNGVMTFYVIKGCSSADTVTNGDVFVRLLYHEDGRLFAIDAFGVKGIKNRSNIPHPWENK